MYICLRKFPIFLNYSYCFKRMMSRTVTEHNYIERANVINAGATKIATDHGETYFCLLVSHQLYTYFCNRLDLSLLWKPLLLSASIIWIMIAPETLGTHWISTLQNKKNILILFQIHRYGILCVFIKIAVNNSTALAFIQ